MMSFEMRVRIQRAMIGIFVGALLVITGALFLLSDSYVRGGCIVYSNTGKVVCAAGLNYPAILLGTSLVILGTIVIALSIKFVRGWRLEPIVNRGMTNIT
jgi:hypothetical protein